MRTLYITFVPPGDDSGGGIVCKQSLLSLKGNGFIDYIGPEIIDDEVRGCLDRMHCLLFDNSRVRFGVQLLRGITSGYYKSWRIIEKQIDWQMYDVVFLESTVYHFASNAARRHNKIIVVRLHNVEQDYYQNLLRIHAGIKWHIRHFLSRYQERKTLQDADGVLCLTEADKQRIVALYPEETAGCELEVVPVALKEPVSEDAAEEEERKKSPEPYRLLMTGSLWYGPNEEGIVWFVRHVWKPLWDNREAYPWIERYRLVIAGSRPTKVLISAVSEAERIRLVESPEDMEPLFREAGLFVAPVFSGAGMKVKVAEAFAHGLPVIGTTHAFIGYRMKDRELGYVANAPHEFMEALSAYHQLSAEDKSAMRNRVKDHFLFYYELHSSRTLFQKFVGHLLKDEIS